MSVKERSERCIIFVLRKPQYHKSTLIFVDHRSVIMFHPLPHNCNATELAAVYSEGVWIHLVGDNAVGLRVLHFPNCCRGSFRSLQMVLLRGCIKLLVTVMCEIVCVRDTVIWIVNL